MILVLSNQERIKVSRTGPNTCGYTTYNCGPALNTPPQEVLELYKKGILGNDGQFVIGDLWRNKSPEIYIPFSNVVYVINDGEEW